MTSIIKNQILKHLSKFAKNLSHDQIHLSTLKGEGELTNLELNDQVLTDLLELPSWLRLSRATCNRVTVRIQWTKLKSVPIQLFLDEVKVDVETCEDLRPAANAANQLPSSASGGQYGFSDKVVDGVMVTVNSVILSLKSHAFVASIQMSRIIVESKSPTWQKADLRMTRVKDTDKGELLIFKELSWQTVRIEAKSTNNEDLTPLRLITNQARCRITIKKKLSNCAVLGCRLVLILDDLLWVLTDDQLKAALHFADSLSGLLKKATEETQKTKGARKLESLSELQAHAKEKVARKRSPSGCAAAKVFARYDVIETSYHFYSDRIDLHLCDDPGGKGRSCHPLLSEGGAFQISLSQLQVDFYPYHLASGDRSAWIRYHESIHAAWLEGSLASFQNRLLDSLLAAARKNHTPLFRANYAQNSKTSMMSLPNASANESQQQQQIRSMLITQFGKLMTTNLVVRLNNFTMWKVSTSKAKATPSEFISGSDKPPIALKARKKGSGDREKYSLPEDMPVMHFEYTQFYYPGDMDFPLPPPKMFAYFNPIQLHLDPLTVLWLNAFSLNLQQSVKMLSPEQTEPPYLDVKIESIMFRIIYDALEDLSVHRQRDRPRSLHLQASRILASNYRSMETGSKADLAKCLNAFQESQLFFGTDFPNVSTDMAVVCNKMVLHATGDDDIRPGVDVQLSSLHHQDWWPVMKKDLLWNEPKDIWYIYIDPIWGDFHGTPSAMNRPVPFIDAFPLSMWLYKQDEGQPMPEPASAQPSQTAKMHLLLQVNSLVSLQLNHYQFLFLMRMLETIAEITTFLTQDVSHILGQNDESSLALGMILPQVDVSLLMPSVSQSRDQIGGDYDTSSVFTAENTSVYSFGNVAGLADGDKTSPSMTVMNSPSTLSLSGDNPPLKSEVASAPVSPSRKESKAFALADNDSASEVATPMRQKLPPAIFTTDPNGKKGKPTKKSSLLTSSLTNMLAQLDSSLRNNSQLQPSHSGSGSLCAMEDDSVSVMSDDSDNSESFVVISQNEAEASKDIDSTLFAIQRSSPIELGTEVTEDSPSEASSHTSEPPPHVASFGGQTNAANCTPSAKKPNGIISVATFHLGRIELSQQSIGRHSCIKVQAASLSGEECTAISWAEFQNKFAVRGKGWCESTLQPPSTWCFKLRFTTSAADYQEMLHHAALESASMSLKEKISRSSDAFVDVKVQNLPLQFYMSTLTGLADLVEDEIIPTPIPMKIHLENLALHLVEDRPSANVTSPGSLPIDIAIPALTITRDKSGLFSIQPSEVVGMESVAHPSVPEVSRPSSKAASCASMTHHLDLVRSGVASIETELQQRASLLAVDNAHLRSQLEQLSEQFHSLQSSVTELEATRAKLVQSQQHTLQLDRENKGLKQTVKYLQEELVKSGKKNCS